MDTPTRDFLHTFGPRLRQIADEAGIDYDYLRQLSRKDAPDAGPEIRRKLLAWGEARAPKIEAALRRLRCSLPDADAAVAESRPAPPPPSEKGPVKPQQVRAAPKPGKGKNRRQNKENDQ